MHASGCQITAWQQQTNPRMALAIEVQAGSHDAPEEWPGLAHFLEHLLFLGGERFTGSERLMPFVQHSGGQVNASTGPTTTQYFFEIGEEQFQGAADRLLDMLARPRLCTADQLGEREVLDAEYHARAADRDQLAQSALLAAMGPGHPLSGFHAGNRSTLPVEDERFQHALQAFHNKHYRAGNCRLAVVGPRTPEVLLEIGAALAAQLPTGQAAERARLPLPQLAPGRWTLTLPNCAPALWVGLHVEGEQLHFQPALEALKVALGSRLPGSLLDDLLEAGWGNELAIHELYRSDSEAILALALELTAEHHAANVEAAVGDWLRFWRDRLETQAQVALLDKPLASLSPLQAARRCLRPLRVEGLGREGRLTLKQLINGMGGRLTSLLVTARGEGVPRLACGFPVKLACTEWPAAHRHLTFTGLPYNPLEVPDEPLSPVPPPTCLHWLPFPEEDAVLHLRLAHDARLPRGAAVVRLRGLVAAAEQAGLSLAVDDSGSSVHLCCSGGSAELPTLVRQVAGALTTDDRGQLAQAPAEMPVRRLLRVLPDIIEPDGPVWASGWDAVLVGMQELDVGRLAAALAPLGSQGLANRRLQRTVRGCQAHRVACDGNDAAVLLFCPVPSDTPTAEATWRLLGQLLPPAFYQRMRGELQLGYGVFCGFRQIRGQAGLLFGVQSPVATTAEILDHIQSFFAHQQAICGALDAAQLQANAQRLAGQLRADQGSLKGRAEVLWQAHLAGHTLAHPDAVLDALTAISPVDLARGLAALDDPATPSWRLLSSS